MSHAFLAVFVWPGVSLFYQEIVLHMIVPLDLCLQYQKSSCIMHVLIINGGDDIFICQAGNK